MWRIILLVVLILAVGQARHAEAAVVTTQNSAIFVVDVPDVSPGANFFTAYEVGISCDEWRCGSEFFWPSPEDMEEYGLERSTPPLYIYAKFGTEPGLDDVGTFYAFGWDYPYERNLSLEPLENIDVPMFPGSLYLTFILLGDPETATTMEAFYIMDTARIILEWGYNDGTWGDDSWWGPGANLTARPYVPVSQVPLPGSLLLILASLAATAALGARRNVAART